MQKKWVLLQKSVDFTTRLLYSNIAALNGLKRNTRFHPKSESVNEGEVQQMYAIIKTGGKQYKVSEQDVIYVEKLDAENGAEVELEVVMACNDGNVVMGKDAAKVTGKVEKTGKQKKITVFKYKAKKNYRRHQGHRQPYTKITITKIAM